ncbi:MAG: hypothetical protein AAB699_00565 [Patescibacteria group bacterium]
MEIIPAILPKTFREIEEKTLLIAGLVDTVQVDIVDGVFAPNTTWPFAKTPQTHADSTQTDADGIPLPPFPFLRGGSEGGGMDRDFEELLAGNKELPHSEELDYEFDLMVANPAEVVPDFVRLGATRVIVHLESFGMGEKGERGKRGERGEGGEELSELIHEWKHSIDVALALKPSTPLSAIEPFLHEVSLVQFMGNDKISFGGVLLDEEKVLPKIRELRSRHPSPSPTRALPLVGETYPALDISVDIGVNLDTAPRLIAAGATRLVAGSAIFGSDNPRGAIEAFKKLG